MIKYINRREKNNDKKQLAMKHKGEAHDNNEVFSENELKNIRISDSLNENMEKINQIIGSNADLIIRNISIGRSNAKPAVVFYFDNIVDSHHVDRDIINPLVLDVYASGLNSSGEIIEQLQAGNIITRGHVEATENLNDLLNGVLIGEAALLIDGVNTAYVISVKGYEYRSVTQSEVEPVVRGSREAFIEVLSVNLGLIRRRVHSPNLTFESLTLGSVGKTKVCMAYIKGLCPANLLDEVRSRLKRINIDEILGSGYIEELIQDNPYSIFPQMRNTERPDVVAAALMEGRIAIITDNTPIALIAPGEFFSLMQSAEDYYNRYIFSSVIRLLRYFAFSISIFAPALYIAVITYHQEMIPTALLISIMSARTEVPLPVVGEAFVMIITFEILHEAGIRLPRAIGQAVSIVGALVIGQAAVQAKVMSPLMVIVVALTAISKFSIAQYNITLPVRLLRFLFMLLASILGMFGIMIGVLFLMFHLFSLESFGKPYMAPLSPFRASDLKDAAIRAPWWAMVRRPAYGANNSRRMKPGQIPHPPEKRGGRS